MFFNWVIMLIDYFFTQTAEIQISIAPLNYCPPLTYAKLLSSRLPVRPVAEFALPHSILDLKSQDSQPVYQFLQSLLLLLPALKLLTEGSCRKLKMKSKMLLQHLGQNSCY
jgi:hypothetical protein